MTFNSRLAKLAEKLAEEYAKGTPSEHARKITFMDGALHPTIEAAIRADERAKVYERVRQQLEARRICDGKKKPSLDEIGARARSKEAESELQRLLSEGGEE